MSISLKIYNFPNKFGHFADNKKYGQIILWFPSSEMRKVMLCKTKKPKNVRCNTGKSKPSANMVRHVFIGNEIY